jgi:hypothetical protein
VPAVVTELVRGTGLSVLAVVAFGALFVLPGVRLADRFGGHARVVVPRLVLAFAFSQAIVAAVGIALIVPGWFSGWAVALGVSPFAITSLPVAVGWVRAAGGLRASGARLQGPVALSGWVIAAVIPWVVNVGRSGWPPADTLQWYYDGLGAQLAAAGGVPTAVAEWGTAIRWLPDYLVFDIDSEAYLALLGFLPRADALAAWRVPVALLGAGLLFAVVRLWVARPAALVGVALTAGTAFYLAKFDAYKPEALGIVLGLAALWLVVRGLRGGGPTGRSWVLLGGACLGLDLSVHAIAATVMGLVVVGFAAAGWLAAKSGRLERAGWLVRAALLGLLISVVMGVGLQGRAVVAGGALNPGTAQGPDPTWTFFLRSTGDFTVPEPPVPRRPLAGGVISPWADLRITSAFGWWLLPAAAIGAVFLAGLGGRRPRAGILGLTASGALVAAGIAFFALGFDTYVPRWTGLVRFGQYLPLFAGLGVTFAIAGYLRLWAWVAQVRIPRQFAVIAALAALAWLVPWAAGRYSSDPAIGPDGQAALAALRAAGHPGDVVLSNVLTTGTIESFTGLEAPLEGRQPLIEQPAFLAHVNELLLDAHRWFEEPVDRGFLDRLGVRWVLVADDPTVLGATATLGGDTGSVGAIGSLTRAWTGSGVTLFELRDPNAGAAVTDDRRASTDPVRVLLIAAVGLAAGALIIGAWPGATRRQRVQTR